MNLSDVIFEPSEQEEQFIEDLFENICNAEIERIKNEEWNETLAIVQGKMYNSNKGCGVCGKGFNQCCCAY